MMQSTEISSVATAEHYGWGDSCDAWYLVKNERLHIIQETMPADTSETRHLHRTAQQFFFVLKGEATLEVDGQILVLREREGVRVAPGAAHQMRNDSGSELQFLVTSEPPSHGDREEATC
jgi:mannose-6-phosphate isomerase-like protein (cupin superfamily)